MSGCDGVEVLGEGWPAGRAAQGRRGLVLSHFCLAAPGDLYCCRGNSTAGLSRFAQVY